MRILVTGANGMLGIDLCVLAESAGHHVIRTDVGQREGIVVPPWDLLDITDFHSVSECLLRHQPDAVIHCAAYTDVDGCERNPDLAYNINALGTWNLATVCGSHHITLAYISTDFVFDGAKQTPYTEFDPVNPLNHYGASKLAGEKLVAQLCPRHYIVRTSWLFGVHGKCFPGVMLRLAQSRPEIDVVVDQVGSPTHTVDLAQTLLALLATPQYGTYHVSNSGHCSWHALALATIEIAGIQNVTIHPIPASQWPTPTHRPAYSVMRHFALELQGRDNLRPWQEALQHYMSRRTTH